MPIGLVARRRQLSSGGVRFVGLVGSTRYKSARCFLHEESGGFLLACHQAAVSVETMSKYLGLDVDTIRSELLLGIEAWNVAQRRNSEAAVEAHLRVAALHD